MKNNECQRCGLNYRSPLFALCAAAYRRFAVAILLIDVTAAVTGSASPLIQKGLIDGVNALDRGRTFSCALAAALLIGLAFACQTGSYLLRYRLGVEARCLLKSAIFHCLSGVPESFMKERGNGYFFNRLQTDSGEIVNFYTGNALTQFECLLKFAFAFAVIAFLHWQCALLTLPFLLCQYLLFRKYGEKQYQLSHEIQECVASERYRMQEYLAGYTTLKTHDAVRVTTEKLDQGFARWRVLAFKRLFLENRFRLFSRAPMFLCCGGVAVYGIEQILRGQWSLGTLWALLMLLRQTFAPMQQLAGIMFQMQTARAAWDRMRQIVSAASVPESAEEREFSLREEIVFSHVRFSYVPGRPLFQDLNFTVRKNELLFLTGANGAGKTTVFQLLLRLYEPLGGEITIGGRPIREFPVAPYRSRIGYLGQSPEFFPGTLRENMLLGTNHSDDEILDALRLLKCEHLVLKRPGGLEAPVSERGENFSGGERLRLALARELLRDTDILLLDEPASSLDAGARKDFYGLLLNLRGRCTIIAITHDVLPASENYSFWHLHENTEPSRSASLPGR